MFESILPDTSIDLVTILIILGVSIVLGLLLAATYIFTHKKTGFNASFPITIIIIPVVVSIIIVLVSNNVARAFSLAGIFTLTRFRSEQQDTKDIAYLFVTIAIGLSTGLGYIGYAVLISVVLNGLLILLSVSNFDKIGIKSKKLKIVIPEDLNIDGVFDDILEKYCKSYILTSTKTTDFGSLFELRYTVVLKDDNKQKELIDEIRTRNGNLNITISLTKYN